MTGHTTSCTDPLDEAGERTALRGEASGGPAVNGKLLLIELIHMLIIIYN